MFESDDQIPRSGPSRTDRRGRSARRLIAGVATAGIAAAGLAVAGVSPASAQQPITLTQLGLESFDGAKTIDANWTLPSGSQACLTAGSDTSQKPIPACASTASDTAGSGALRLTTNANDRVGTVYSTVSLPTAQGLDITFDSYQYNGTGADGIAFVLAATDPTNPSAPATSGPPGGTLGYNAKWDESTVPPGVSYGYLGFGLDVFGNFSNKVFSNPDCGDTTGALPGSITVRGPGNGLDGYCVLSTKRLTGSEKLDQPAATSRPTTSVPVEVALNPSGSAVVSTSGLSVPAHSWAIAVTPYGASAAEVLTGTLPSMSDVSGMPAGWLDPASGLPRQLTFGWSASTGGATEIHEINKLHSETLTGQLPVYRLAVSDDHDGDVTEGDSGTVSVTPSLADGEGSEEQPVTVRTTFPDGLVPGAFTPTTGYSCDTAGKVVTCTYTPTAPVGPGDTLPTLEIPWTVADDATVGSGPSVTREIQAKVSSVDANPAAVGSDLTIAQRSLVVSGADITDGHDGTLSFSGLPTGATGTVAFTSGGTTLCSVTLTSAMTGAGNSGSCTVPGPAQGTYPVLATYTPGPDSTYAKSLSATTTFTVAPAPAKQTVAFASTPPQEPVPGSTYELSAISDAGLPVTYEVDPATTNNACSIHDGVVSFDHPGVCVINAIQAGDATHQAARAQQRIVIASTDVATPVPTAKGEKGRVVWRVTKKHQRHAFAVFATKLRVRGDLSCTGTARVRVAVRYHKANGESGWKRVKAKQVATTGCRTKLRLRIPARAVHTKHPLLRMRLVYRDSTGPLTRAWLVWHNNAGVKLGVQRSVQYVRVD